MTIKILKTSPRFVFLSNDKVYKFFNSGHECSQEIKLIRKSPLLELYDEENKYKMKFIKILETSENFYTMELIKGDSININNNLEDFRFAGIWLSHFHKLTYDTKNKKVFIFGDFVPDHLFIDHEHKEICTLDPGHLFGTKDIIERDIANFFVDLMFNKNFKIIKLYKILRSFLHGYGLNKVDSSILEKNIKLRILNKSKQIINLSNRYFIAYFFFLYANIKYFLIRKKLNKMN